MGRDAVWNLSEVVCPFCDADVEIQEYIEEEFGHFMDDMDGFEEVVECPMCGGSFWVEMIVERSWETSWDDAESSRITNLAKQLGVEPYYLLDEQNKQEEDPSYIPPAARGPELPLRNKK